MSRESDHAQAAARDGASSDVGRLASLLAGTAPFTGMPREKRERLAASMKARVVPAGDYVLHEGGAPGTEAYLVADGAFELVRGRRVMDVLVGGQLFGHPTLLTGYPPEFSVRARQDSLMYVIPGEQALDALSRPEGVAFVAATLRDRLAHVARLFEDQRRLHDVPVASLITRPPIIIDPDWTILRAAKAMSDSRSSAVLVRLRTGLGIVTTSDLRDRVLAAGASMESPVTTILSTPVRTVSGETPASEGTIEMLDAGVTHLPVLDRSGEIVGILSSSDLMTLDEMSPFALRTALLSAQNEDDLARASERLPSLFLALLDAGASSSIVTRILTLQVDALTSRLVDLAVQRYGPPPVAFAWLALGSAARGELTLASDQDNALAYADGNDGEAHPYFRRLAEEVNQGLARCGFALDYSGVNAMNADWCQTQQGWLDAFGRCVDSPGQARLMRASIVFDFRRVAGSLDITPQFVRLLVGASTRTGFVGAMASSVVETPSPLNFRRRLRGPINIKKTGLQPITNLARFHALANGIAVVPTLARLDAVEIAGALDPKLVRSLHHAFERVMQFRLAHHAEAMRQGRKPDEAVDTELLDPLTHAELQEALRIIDSAQQLVQSFPLGTLRT
jgi:CBS domain-containing protein